jgi:hypothetical protein
MEVIGHDYEFMEPEFALAAVVVQHAHESSSRPFRLKKISLVRDRGRNEESSSAGSRAHRIGVTSWN